VIYLLGCTAMAVGTIVAVLTPGDDPGIVIYPTFGLFGLMILLGLVERLRRREEYAREKERIGTDEWMVRGMHRARGFAFQATMFLQVPFMFGVAYLPPEPTVSSSVAGMGGLTIAIGCALWAGSYLYFTREPVDG
jgi:hypothetical protein